jgi:hypothetical protein
LTKDIIVFIQNEILTKQNLLSIQLYTKARIPLTRQNKYSGDKEAFCVTIRAHPEFRSHSERHGYPNYHWVYLKGSRKKEGIRLIRCLAFCEVNNCKYVIGQWNQENPYLTGSGVQEMIKRFTVVPTSFRLIALKRVIKTACVIPNDLDQPEPITNWLLIRAKEDWTEMFSLEMQQRIKSANNPK